MRLAVAFGIFALGLTGLGAIACQPKYGEEVGAPTPTDTTTKSATLPAVDGGAQMPAATPIVVRADGAVTPGKPGATEGDAGVPSVDGGVMCPAPMPAGGFLSVPPSPPMFGACSAADIGFFEGLLAVEGQTYAALQTATQQRSELCASCIFSTVNDVTWSPVVMLGPSAAFFNWGSCWSNAPGGNVECGQQVQKWFTCLNDSCAQCSDDVSYDACQKRVAGDPAACGGISFEACGTELPALDAQCATVAQVLTYACGAPEY